MPGRTSAHKVSAHRRTAQSISNIAVWPRLTGHPARDMVSMVTFNRAENANGSEQIGRYTLVAELAAGGMATVHLARFQGEAGFSRTVVVKRLHPHYAKDHEFVCMFLDEARLASRVRHPNVVPVVDVVSHRGELLLAMDYVHGVSLSTLVRASQGQPVPLPIALALARDLLAGLHAAHETHDKHGLPMQIVHRDVSPQNLMVGDDGVGRVVDFGIASATARMQTTRDGQIKGKLSYMAPEQIRGQVVDRRADVFASGIVLWQLTTGAAFASGPDETRIHFILTGDYSKPSSLNAQLPEALDRVVMKALAIDPAERFASAEEMLRALSSVALPAAAYEVSDWVRSLVGSELGKRAALVRRTEQISAPPPNAGRSVAEPRSADHSTTRQIITVPTAHASVARVPSEPPPKHGRRRWLLLAALLLLVPAAGALLLMQRDTGTESALPRVTPSPAPPAATPAAPPAAVAVSTDQAPPAPTGSPAPAASAPSVRTTTAPKPVQRPASKASTGRSPAAAPAPKATDPCSPPYVLLDGGIRKYKPECL